MPWIKMYWSSGSTRCRFCPQKIVSVKLSLSSKHFLGLINEIKVLAISNKLFSISVWDFTNNHQTKYSAAFDLVDAKFCTIIFKTLSSHVEC